MVVFYKYIYTEMLLCRSSWGFLLQFRTPCFLVLLFILDQLGLGDHVSCCQTRVVEEEDTHIHCPCSCHRPSSLHNDFSLSRMLPVGTRNTGLW